MADRGAHVWAGQVCGDAEQLAGLGEGQRRKRPLDPLEIRVGKLGGLAVAIAAFRLQILRDPAAIA